MAKNFSWNSQIVYYCQILSPAHPSPCWLSSEYSAELNPTRHRNRGQLSHSRLSMLSQQTATVWTSIAASALNPQSSRYTAAFNAVRKYYCLKRVFLARYYMYMYMHQDICSYLWCTWGNGPKDKCMLIFKLC